jgi:outer membrane immunogenic protein
MIDMKRLILGVAAALMFGAGQAAADGLPSKGAVRGPDGPDGPEVAIWNWNGFYLGAGIGGGAQDVDNGGVSIGGEGVLGTVSLGYDRVLRPGWVGGVFADYDFSGISEDLGGGVSLDHNYSWSIGARLGTLVTPRTLLYGTVGYTQAEFELNNDAQTFDGYFVGAGIEHFLRDNWTLKFEYRYSDYEARDVDAEASLHTARLVLSYKFGQR